MPRNNYKQLIRKIELRLNPDHLPYDRATNDLFVPVQGKSALTYLIHAQKTLDTTYSLKTFEAGNRILNTLRPAFPHLDFEFQGSILTDTNIHAHGTITVLMICNCLSTSDLLELDEWSEDAVRTNANGAQNRVLEVNQNGLVSDSLFELKRIRQECERTLKQSYAHLDCQGDSMVVKLQNMNRKVRVILANWLNNHSVNLNCEKAYLGIQVFNYENMSFLPVAYPFLSLKRIQDRNAAVGGRLSMMIRMLKNLASDASEEIHLTTLDIQGICFSLDENKYMAANNFELALILLDHIHLLLSNYSYRLSIKTVDGTKPIFIKPGEMIEDTLKVQALRKLSFELEQLMDVCFLELIQT